MLKKGKQNAFIEEQEEHRDWRPRINYQWIVKNLPFLFFLAMLAILYIANGHYAVKNIRELDKLQKEVKELHWRFLDAKTDLMFRSKMSEVSEGVSPYGLGVPTMPPLDIKAIKTKNK